MDEIKDENMKEFEKSLIVQKDQRNKIENNINKISVELSKLEKISAECGDLLDSLLKQAEGLCVSAGFDANNYTVDNIEEGMSWIELTDEEKNSINIPYFDVIDTVNVSKAWDAYFNSVKNYAKYNDVDLSVDPYAYLLTENERNLIGQRVRDDYLMRKAHCDKYDYILATVSGVLCGLIDSFFVGMPGDSKLGQWTDKKADEFVMNVSKKIWNYDSKQRDVILQKYKNKEITLEQRNKLLKKAGIPYNQNINKEPDTLQNCIQYLEKKFGVNYDAPTSKGVVEQDVLKGMNPINHHLMSLAHSPSPIGLLFSILDQFTGKATFVDDGKIVRLTPVKKANELDEFELRGSTFATKLLCGTINWLGHLISDLAGSNTTRATDGSRGSGLPMPFFEILQMCNFGFKDKDGVSITFSTLSLKVFEKGYDLRFGAACAIPVLINEFLIRVLWSLKARFYHNKKWSESMPFGNQPELRRMLLVGHGVLCSVDVIDAGLRSGGELLGFCCHLNAVAWGRFAFGGLQEIRALYKENVIDINALDDDLDREWKNINRELEVYLM